MAFVRVLAFSLLARSVVSTLGDHQTCGAGEDCGSEETSLLAVPVKRTSQTQMGVAEAPTLLATDVAVKRSWNCPAPYKATECVESSWTGWTHDKHKFEEQCNGNLVGKWGDDQYVDDCGEACFFCSFIKACCDDCTTISSVKGYWGSVGYRSVETAHKVTHGITRTQSETWSVSESWSRSVSAEVSRAASVEVEGVGASSSMKLSAQSSHSFARKFSSSWSVTETETTEASWVQPGGTTGWVWYLDIETTCGVKTAVTENYQITNHQNPPCCMPGANATSDPYGDCYPNGAGEIINLCKGTITKAVGE